MGRSQIIKDLANGKCDLATSLKRTKVLIKYLDDEKLIAWINNEIEVIRKRIIFQNIEK